MYYSFVYISSLKQEKKKVIIYFRKLRANFMLNQIHTLRIKHKLADHGLSIFVKNK